MTFWFFLFGFLISTNIYPTRPPTLNCDFAYLVVTGKPVQKNGLQVAGLGPNDQIRFLGRGAEGTVYRIVIPDGSTYVLKVFDQVLASGGKYVTVPIGSTRELAQRKIYFETARGALDELGRIPELGTGPFRIAKLEAAYPESLILKLSDVKGISLDGIDGSTPENPKDTFWKDADPELRRQVYALFQKELEVFKDRLKQTGWTPLYVDCMQKTVGETRHIISFSLRNVIFDPVNRTFTLVDTI